MSTLRYVGLDVHKNSIVIAVADGASGQAEVVAKIGWPESRVLVELRKLGPLKSVKVWYAAGYGFQRHLP